MKQKLFDALIGSLLEKVAFLKALPSRGLAGACFPVTVARPSAGWVRGGAMIAA